MHWAPAANQACNHRTHAHDSGATNIEYAFGTVLVNRYGQADIAATVGTWLTKRSHRNYRARRRQMQDEPVYSRERCEQWH
jgi:hypothetical protein